MNPKEESTNPSRPDIENTENEDIIEKSQDFIQKNRILIIIAVAVIIVAAGAIWYLNSQQEKNEEAAAFALSKVVQPYAEGNYQLALRGDTTAGKAAMGLTRIADEYDGTIQGKQAALYAGNALLAQNEYSEARRYFEIAQDADSYLIKIGANAGIGATLEYEDKFAEAAEYYEKAANISKQDFVKEKYNYFAALAYENAGNTEKAEQIYREIVNNDEFSEFGALSKQGLARLGTIIE